MSDTTTTSGTPARVLLSLALLASMAVWLLRPGGQRAGDKPAPGDAGAVPGTAVLAVATDDSGVNPAGGAKHSDRSAREEKGRASSPADDEFGVQEPIHGDSPEVIRSQVRALVPAGQSMITGGHRLEDGRHEFTVISPKWMEMPDGSKQIDVEIQLLNLDDAEVESAGLETLLTGERKSEQNAEVWTPEELARTMKDVNPTALQSKPRIVTSPGSPARITVGAERGAKFELEFSASEAAEGGFELTTDLKRIE